MDEAEGEGERGGVVAELTAFVPGGGVRGYGSVYFPPAVIYIPFANVLLLQ